ncbi:tyrosinase-like protein [Xylariomycetidae sp. FL0641]|nr:tyrosinase-like protein [Xylariomycetidae sp. FL0641]
MRYSALLLAATTVSAAAVPAPASPSSSSSAAACAQPSRRVEWRSLSSSDQESFVRAMQCLMELAPAGAHDTDSNITSRYDEVVAFHHARTDLIHQYSVFLPYHRYLLAGFEGLLRAECGYAAPLPWWHEPASAGDFAGASGLFTPALFGTLRVSHAPEDQPADSWCVTDGAFANRTVRIGLPEQCLSRGETRAYSALASAARLDACQGNVTTYAAHAECVANGIHISTHAAVGPVLGNVPASVNDPVFWLHHGFVDWEWLRWQRVADARWADVSGCVYSDDDADDCLPVDLDYVLSSDGIFPNMTVREVMNPTTGPLCYEYDFY